MTPRNTRKDYLLVHDDGGANSQRRDREDSQNHPLRTPKIGVEPKSNRLLVSDSLEYGQHLGVGSLKVRFWLTLRMVNSVGTCSADTDRVDSREVSVAGNFAMI